MAVSRNSGKGKACRKSVVFIRKSRCGRGSDFVVVDRRRRSWPGEVFRPRL